MPPKIEGKLPSSVIEELKKLMNECWANQDTRHRYQKQAAEAAFQRHQGLYPLAALTSASCMFLLCEVFTFFFAFVLSQITWPGVMPGKKGGGAAGAKKKEPTTQRSHAPCG